MKNLPAFRGIKKVIVQDQDTNDIIREVYAAHKVFAKDYDQLTDQFTPADPVTLAKNVFDFCKKNLNYRIESEDLQTTRSPSGILYTKNVDCKHYAGFIAGVLDAYRRKYNYDFDLYYRFGNYNIFDTLPGHVFVVMKKNGRDYWIDPVLKNFDQRDPSPINYVEKKIKRMALIRVSGLTNVQQMSSRQRNYLSGLDISAFSSQYDQLAAGVGKELDKAVASLPFVGLAQGLLTSFFGQGGLADWLSPAGILNEIKSALFGRLYRGGQYWLGEKFRYYIMNEDIHTKDADVVTDAAVATAITTFSVGFGVPIEDYQDILNLQKGADAYIARYKLLGADPNLISRDAVNRAVQLKQSYFPTEYEGNWSKTGKPPTAWNPNDFNRIKFVVPIPDFTKPYAEMWKNTYTGKIPDGEVVKGIVVAGNLTKAGSGSSLPAGSAAAGMTVGTWLLIGAAAVGGYLIIKKRR